MNIDSIIMYLRLELMYIVATVSQTLSKIARFGTNNPGMYKYYRHIEEYASRPWHKSQFPPSAMPTNWYEAFFGAIPKFLVIKKRFYEDEEGFYNFYVDNYRNIHFLPDWISKWIQLHFDLIDSSNVEIALETIFLMIVYYHVLLTWRINLYFFPTINPYTRPWVYILTLTDFMEGIIFDLGLRTPFLLGLPIAPMLIVGGIGRMADSLNHLVITIPFLPSEGEVGLLEVNGRLKKVVLFRYLPSLWAKYPIPDRLREFWYQNRPDIYRFMKSHYEHLGINFLPDRIVNSLPEEQSNILSLLEQKEIIENGFSQFNFLCILDLDSSSFYLNEIFKELNNHLIL